MLESKLIALCELVPEFQGCFIELLTHDSHKVMDSLSVPLTGNWMSQYP